MADNNTHKYKKDVLRLATFIGQLMLRNGAETKSRTQLSFWTSRTSAQSKSFRPWKYH